MIKRKLIVGCCLTVGLMLAGCGNKEVSNQSATTTQVEITTEAETTTEVETTTEEEEITSGVEVETTEEVTEAPTTEAPTAESPTTEPQVGAEFKVGDYIKFGSYEQDNDTSNGKEKIEWLVLEIKDGKALLISKYGLDAQYYNIESEQLAWDKCTLRKWLNDTFYNTAFSDNEMMIIHTSSVDYGYSDLTQDKLFLLSTEEANTYFGSNEERVCQLTKYAECNGAQLYEGGNCCWWLRTRGTGPEPTAVIVISFGMVYESGAPFKFEKYAVRPAMWINLNT